MGQFIQIESRDGFRLPVYEARPAGTPRGAIVVIQEIFGVNAHIQAVADGYAQEGYLALAPAIFERLEAGVDMGYAPEDMKRGVALKAALEGQAQASAGDIQAVISYAGQAAGGKVGIVGFCYGGLIAWRAAEQADGLAAAVAYYGGGVTTPAEVGRTPKVPVLAHFGERDTHIPLDGVEAFRQQQSGRDVEVHVYAADHGFNCDHRGAFDADAARLAKQRTLDFFARHLG
ncbi:carboxymethylenebutenolidase [Kerstersia gyiorum]|uniref:Carboxymethylenebutenolidase n=1 Tax=Kerstersia gyiorum TaxID=206506 RepID=A0A4Q7M6W1_9BURK|nr:dienelactone hydrolase family protein [Kerstersia gyiorum]KAB0541706.1 dienelactone hydrolase family protein [Kerstersia gyiorum]RZS63775.1 carboxymethylenebutenolidase [Kerstersia gyiorum]